MGVRELKNKLGEMPYRVNTFNNSFYSVVSSTNNMNGLQVRNIATQCEKTITILKTLKTELQVTYTIINNTLETLLKGLAQQIIAIKYLIDTVIDDLNKLKGYAIEVYNEMLIAVEWGNYIITEYPQIKNTMLNCLHSGYTLQTQLQDLSSQCKSWDNKIKITR